MFGIFQINFKQALIVILLLALPIISINLEKRAPGGMRWYDRPVTLVINPLQELFTRFSAGVAGTSSYYLNLLDVKKENRQLRETLQKMKMDLASADEAKTENTRLQKLLRFQQIDPPALVPAQVIATDLFSPEYASLKINKGTAEGLKKGMGALTPEGIVGYILNAQAHYSTVLVVTDRNAIIDAMIQRSRARGAAQGLGKDLIRLKYLQRTDDVQKGDTVITGGQDGVFPKGLLIGTVSSVFTPKFGVTQKVELRPAIDVSRTEELLVVTNSVARLTAEPSPSPTEVPK